MPKSTKKAAVAALALLMLSPIFTSCGNNEKPSETESDITSSSNTSLSDTTGKSYSANIPEGTDLGGYEFRILTNEVSRFVWGDVDFISDGESGDVINDAVYSRNINTEDKLNIKIKAMENANIMGTVTKSVQSGEDAYDLAYASTHAASTLAQNGIIMRLDSMKTLDLSAPWWDSHSVEDLSVANKVYMITGDIGTMYKKSIGVIMFNKKILTNNSLEDPYTLMKNKNWTIDNMIGMGTTVSADLNGDDIYDKNDMYGLIYFGDMMGLAVIGSGVQFAEKNSDDIPQLSFYSDKTVSVFEKLSQLLYDSRLSFSWSKNNLSEEVAFNMFQNDQSLFYYGELHAVATMRNMNSDFGILPMPLYSDDQENYYHCINPHVAPMVTVPASVKDSDRIGYILDTMGALSKNVLTPAYYDTTLKGKVTRDEESSASLDIVLSTIRYDIGYLSNWGMTPIALDLCNSYSLDIASKYEKVVSSVEKNMQKTISAYTAE